MKLNIKIIFSAMIAITIQGCNLFESTFDKQVKTCAGDVKLGLGDPESLEIVSTTEIKLDDGLHRVQLNYTAKNAMGGRVRGETICGFKGKDSTELNPDDHINKQRKLFRELREIGVQF